MADRQGQESNRRKEGGETMRLIDADALIKALEVIQYNDIDDLSRTEDLIDNAPTVEAKTTHDVNSAYDRGFITAMKEYSRPTGEWKRDNYGDVFCSNCGVECAYNEEGLYSLGRFCHHCGADMRKGDES